MARFLLSSAGFWLIKIAWHSHLIHLHNCLSCKNRFFFLIRCIVLWKHTLNLQHFPHIQIKQFCVSISISCQTAHQQLNRIKINNKHADKQLAQTQSHDLLHTQRVAHALATVNFVLIRLCVLIRFFVIIFLLWARVRRAYRTNAYMRPLSIYKSLFCPCTLKLLVCMYVWRKQKHYEFLPEYHVCDRMHT